MKNTKSKLTSLWPLVSLYSSSSINYSIVIDREEESDSNHNLYMEMVLNDSLFKEFTGTFPSIINLLNSLSPTQVKDLSVTDLFDRILS